MDNGPQEIRALDGLRAIAALSIVAFHTYLTAKLEYKPWGPIAYNFAYFLATGVHLFFVLSGFLLFLPYVRAMLHARSLPSAKRFYRRRALRILPAYWACLTLLLFLAPSAFKGLSLAQDIGVHVILVHDDFPRFAQDLDGPFWTLAVEVQFYVVLPLLAFLTSKLVGASRSLARLAIGVGCIIATALLVRTADAVIMTGIPTFSGITGTIARVFVLITMGSLGKFLEVFAVGMLCATLYVATVEEKMFSPKQQHRLAWLLLGEAVVLLAALVPFQTFASSRYAPGTVIGFAGVTIPFFIGLGYGSLLLAIVWGNKFIRAPFEFYPLRFIGLISYSLYMWHLPIIHPLIPALASLTLKLRVPLAFLVAYLSYQLVERPFLSRRHKNEQAKENPAALPVADEPALAVGQGTP